MATRDQDYKTGMTDTMPEWMKAEMRSQVGRARRERDEALAEAGRLADREAHFAHVLSVADSGQYQADWETAIKRVVAQRDAARAQVAALQDALRAFTSKHDLPGAKRGRPDYVVMVPSADLVALSEALALVEEEGNIS